MSVMLLRKKYLLCALLWIICKILFSVVDLQFLEAVPVLNPQYMIGFRLSFVRLEKTELCIARSNGANNVKSVSDQRDIIGQHIQGWPKNLKFMCYAYAFQIYAT